MKTKEAIERVRSRFDKWALDSLDLAALQTLGLVDVKRSKDERIKEAIAYAIGQSTHYDGTLINGVSSGEALAYLKTWPNEQKPVDIEYKLPLDAEKQKEIDDASSTIQNFFNKEQKPAEWSDDIIRKAVKEVGLTQHQIDWFKTNVFPPKQEWSEEDDAAHTRILGAVAKAFMGVLPTKLSKEDVHWIKILPERFNLSPKQEWSEEDEKIIDGMIVDYKGEIEHLSNSTIDEQAKPVYQERIDFLKRLKTYCSQSYNEDFQKIINDAIFLIEHYASHDDKNLREKVISELKSLHPQPHWKPTKEQMYILNWVANILLNHDGIVEEEVSKKLQSLHDDLKKHYKL